MVITSLYNAIFRCILKDVSSNYERVSYVNLVVLPGNDNVSSEPPKIIPTRSFDGSRTVLILEEDQNTILDCIASGIPKPLITWVATTLNGRIIIQNKKSIYLIKKIYHTIWHNKFIYFLTFWTFLQTVNGSISLQVSHGSIFRNSINISTELARGLVGNFTCVADNGIGEPVSRVRSPQYTYTQVCWRNLLKLINIYYLSISKLMNVCNNISSLQLHFFVVFIDNASFQTSSTSGTTRLLPIPTCQNGEIWMQSSTAIFVSVVQRWATAGNWERKSQGMHDFLLPNYNMQISIYGKRLTFFKTCIITPK